MTEDDIEKKRLLSTAPVVRKPAARPILPSILLILISALLYGCFVFFHLAWELDTRDKRVRARVYAEAVAVHFFFGMTVICLLIVSLSSPGTTPRDKPWDPAADGHGYPKCVEVKPSGELRMCTKCGLYKPDRAHHDSKTQQCVLEMDHYCPWVYNVVGYNNRKAFVLLLLYASTALVTTTVFMIPTLGRAMSGEFPIGVAFVCSFAIFTAAGLGLVLTAFFFFHCWLVSNNYTTIEYYEKKNSTKYADLRERYQMSVFDLGFFHNVFHLFGYNPLLWFVPFNVGRSSDGAIYDVAEEHILTEQMRQRVKIADGTMEEPAEP